MTQKQSTSKRSKKPHTDQTMNEALKKAENRRREQLNNSPSSKPLEGHAPAHSPNLRVVQDETSNPTPSPPAAVSADNTASTQVSASTLANQPSINDPEHETSHPNPSPVAPNGNSVSSKLGSQLSHTNIPATKRPWVRATVGLRNDCVLCLRDAADQLKKMSRHGTLPLGFPQNEQEFTDWAIRKGLYELGFLPSLDEPYDPNGSVALPIESNS